MSPLPRLDHVKSWRATPRSFSAWTIDFHTNRIARAGVRRVKGEPVEAMVARGLDELERRLREGMPEPKPRKKRRLSQRELSLAASPSQLVN